MARRRTRAVHSQESDRAEDRAAMLDAVMGPLDGDAPNLESPPFLGAFAVNFRDGIHSIVSAYNVSRNTYKPTYKPNPKPSYKQLYLDITSYNFS